MAHYDIKTLGAAVKSGTLAAGDTYVGYSGGDRWTYNGSSWVKTAQARYVGIDSIKDWMPDVPAKDVTETNDKLPPMTCSEGCGFTNEYVGKEHLINGLYVCRQCRPGYERRQRTLALKAQNEEAAGDPYAYGPSWKDGVGGL